MNDDKYSKVLELLLNSYGVPRFNTLIENFPSFIPIEFSSFILSSKENSSLVNYIFHEIYPQLISNKSEQWQNSLNQFIKLLNSLSQDAQITLWEEKQPRLYDWYKSTQVIHSYYREINQERMVNNMIYLIYNSIKHSKSIEDAKKKLKLATGLLIYLNEESIATISEHEYFQRLYEGFHRTFNQEEMSILIKMKPEILSLLNFSESETDLRYHATLYLSDKSDIASVQNLIVSEYESIQKKVKNKLSIEGANFISNQYGIFLKLEYLIELIRLFPENKQMFFLEELVGNPETKFLIRDYDRDIISSLIRDKFKIIEEIKTTRRKLNL
ncbi:MAG: hypothetical protein SFU98_13500 [Leptospiraceae bacterium]|nr:hypothetical protein [Leptospiraceae bacterium]